MNMSIYANPVTWPVPGMWVDHREYGEGEVLAVAAGEDDDAPGIAAIRFDDGTRALPVGTFTILPS
jgi:hypothetical protein